MCTSVGIISRCAGFGSYSCGRDNCNHYFLTLHSVNSQRQLQVGRVGSIFTKEISKYLKTGLLQKRYFLKASLPTRHVALTSQTGVFIPSDDTSGETISFIMW